MKITVPVTFDIPDDMYRIDKWSDEELFDLPNTPRYSVTGCAPVGIDNYTVQEFACDLLIERGWSEGDFFPDSEYSQLFIDTDRIEVAQAILLAVQEATAQAMAMSASALVDGLT